MLYRYIAAASTGGTMGGFASVCVVTKRPITDLLRNRHYIYHNFYIARFGPSFRSGGVHCVVKGLGRLSHYSLSKRPFLGLSKLAKIKQNQIKMCSTLLISTSSEQFYKAEVWLTHVGPCRSEQISVRGQAKQAKYVFRYQSLFH